MAVSPRAAEPPDPDEIEQRLAAEPEPVQRQARFLVAFHRNSGIKQSDTLACIEHYLAHTSAVTDARRYYHPKSPGFDFAVQQASIARVNADHARIKAEERAYSNGAGS